MLIVGKSLFVKKKNSMCRGWAKLFQKRERETQHRWIWCFKGEAEVNAIMG